MSNFPHPKSSASPSRICYGPFLRFLGIALAPILVLGVAAGAGAQMVPIQNNGRSPQNPTQMPQMAVPGSVGPSPNFESRRIRQLNVERQKEMISDTQKLLTLTAQLNADVAKNHSATLTPDQLRTLAKIEKLAKSVKEKMSNPVQGTVFQDGFPGPISSPVIP